MAESDSEFPSLGPQIYCIYAPISWEFPTLAIRKTCIRELLLLEVQDTHREITGSGPGELCLDQPNPVNLRCMNKR